MRSMKSEKSGRIMGVEITSTGLQVVKAQVPLAEMLRYATDLKSMTSGRGMYSMKFSHYQEAPHKVSEAVIAQSKKEES